MQIGFIRIFIQQGRILEASTIFTHKKYDDLVAVKINISRATMDSAPQFREYLNKLVEDGNEKFIIDLSFCDFLDSSFLGSMVASLKKIRSLKGNLVIVNNKEVPAGILSLTNLDRVFQIYQTVEDAVIAFRQNS